MFTPKSRTKSTIEIWFTILVLLAVTGCQQLETIAPFPLDLSARTSREKPQTQAPDGPTCFVEFYPKQGKPSRVSIPLTEQMTVRHALQQSGGARRFRKMEIDVIRTVNAQGKKTKMGVQYLPSKRQIAAHTDYVLHPRDRIVVKEDTSTVLHDALGPLSKFLGD